MSSEALVTQAYDLGIPCIPLADLISIQSGYAFASEDYTSSGHFLVRIGNVQDGEIRLDNPKYVMLDKRTRPFELTEGDVLTSLTGNIGRVARIEKAHVPAALNQRVARLSVKDSGKLDCGYLYYALSTPDFREKLSLDGGGAAQQNVSPKAIARISIPLPPLDEQRRIAEVLRSVDEVLHATTTALELLKALKSGVLHDIITRDALPDGWVPTPIASLGAKVKHAIVDGPFGSNLKSEHYRSEGIPVFQSGFVTSSQFKPTKYVFVDEALFQQQIRSRAVGGDILMAKIGAQAGRCAIIPSDHHEGIIAGNCLKITVDPDQCSAVFLHTVLTFMYQVTGLREIITETAQPAISLARLRTLIVPLPPLAEQASIMEGIHSLDLAIEAETNKQTNLSNLKSALMSDLLSGRVRVPT